MGLDLNLQDFGRRMEREFEGQLESLTPLSQLVVLQPAKSSNPVASALYRAIVAHIKASLPGELKGPGYFGNVIYDSGTYRSLFYPGYRPDCYESLLCQGPYDHLDQAQWSAFAVALLCQDIYMTGSMTRREMRREAIDRQIQSYNAQCNSRLWIWYAQVFMHELPDYTRLVAELGGPGEALRKYEAMLRSEQWQQMVGQMIHNGSFPDPEWFFYHTWIKLVCLAVRDLNGLIEQVVQGTKQGVPITVRQDTWRSYRTWMPVDSISYRECKEAEPRILKSAYVVTRGAMAAIPEFYASSFLGGPGKDYKNPPSSCFAAGAKVRMADGTLREIERIRMGDGVMTPSGARSVMLLVNEGLADRRLYSLNECSAKFTALHPFVRAGEKHEPLANPGREELVYDLILEPNEQGTSEYYIGDDSAQFLTMSEFPVFMHVPCLTATMLMMLSTLYENTGSFVMLSHGRRALSSQQRQMGNVFALQSCRTAAGGGSHGLAAVFDGR